MDSRLILILSSERSGSTLTRVILGEHPRIVAPAEMFLMRYPDYRTFRAEKGVAVESLVEFFELVGQPRDAAAIDTTCRDMSTLDVYRWLSGFLGPDQMLLDKTPAYANEGDTLRRAEHLAPFYVWLIRHPFGVIESHLRLKARERHTADLKGFGRRVRDQVVDSMARFAKGLVPLARQREMKWVVQQTVIREFLATVPAERQCTIRFEHLVRDPETEVARLCQALGLDVQAAMLEATGARRKMNVHLGDPNFHTHDRIDPATADTWKQYFTEDRLTLETRRLMDRIGVADRSPAGR